MRPPDILAIGENSVDYVYRVPSLPRAGGPAKIPISACAVSPGGQVATMACACAALGLGTRYVGTFGDDGNGRLIRGVLEARGVDVSLAPVRRAPNRYAVILVDEASGERVVLPYRDPLLALSPSAITEAMFDRVRLVHVDATDGNAALAAADRARALGVPVTSDIDGADGRARVLLDAVTIPILAEGVPEAMSGQRDTASALRALRRSHHRYLCVTLGARGAMLLAGDVLHEAPALRIDAVDTTGAGDVFRAAFACALLRGDSPPDILRFATAAAALSCTRRGAIDSVVTLDEVRDLLMAS